MQRVTENVYAATDIRGCNPGYVVTSDGVVIIDTPQLPTKAVAMREEALEKGPIRFLINTENHIDHIFGNHFFAGLCPVVGHEHILKDFWKVLSGDPYPYSVEVVKKDDLEGMALMPTEQEFVVNAPTIVFSHGMTIRVGDHIFELFHTPGHTKGQIAVYVPKEKVAFVGDTIFCECQTWFHGADPDAWLWSLGFLSTLDLDYIVPGHGPICKKDYIPKQGAFIREWVTAVAVGIAKGWSKEECIERISFLDRFPVDMGQESAGPMIQERAVDRIYDFLHGKAERFR
ncbi:MAG: MBL fold metallo-hydrolase [Desulfobacteraceae bacterium]|nr:MBL fold metallo-hydrolase [Desulfobacteraceae bacterium]